MRNRDLNPRDRFGAKSEVLLGDRPGDRALRLSDMDGLIAEAILRVVAKAGYSTGGGGGLVDGVYGDITISGGGTVLTVNSGAVTAAEVGALAATVQAYPLDVFADPVGPVEFAQQQALQFVVENRTSDPGAPVSGQIWLRTDL